MDVYTFLVGFRLIRNFYPDMMGYSMIWVPGSRTWSSRTLVSLEDSRGRFENLTLGNLVEKLRTSQTNGSVLQTFLAFLELSSRQYIFARSNKVVLVPLSTYSTFSFFFFRMDHQPLKEITTQGRNTATCRAARKKASPGVKVLTQISLQWPSRRPQKGK